MNVVSRSAVEECVGVIKTRLDNRCSNSGGHGFSECRSDVSERPGMEMNVSTKRLCVLLYSQVVVQGDAKNFNRV